MKIPAILCDIDGVLVRGKFGINKSANALNFIRQPL